MEDVTRVGLGVMLSRREQLVMLEIGLDSIASASSFVEYMCDSYGISKSSVWYILKRLKDRNLLDFATKDEPGKILGLTRYGKDALQTVERSKMEILNYFTDTAMHETVGIHRIGIYPV